MRAPWRRRCLLAGGVAVLAAGCAATGPRPVQPGDARLDAARFAEIDAAIGQAIAQRKLPGAVFRLERDGAVFERAYGRLSYAADARPVAAGTLFDAASLTKVLATAPAVLMLAEEGRIDLDARLVDYFPECAGGGRDGITIRHLLTHSSGLPAGLGAQPAWHGDAAAHALACGRASSAAPGTLLRYSDVNYILLGQLVARVSGMPLDAFAQRRIFGPLGMRATGYLPLRHGADAAAIAPTQRGAMADGAAGAAAGPASAHGDLAPGQLLQGVVHDPTARRMGGVAGSAGVFTTAADLARYARMLLQGGALDGVRILSPAGVRLLTTVQTPAGLAPRAMGMDIDSPYALRPRGALYPVGSYGHTGFTGCVLWIDPGSRSFYVLLSNRVYPDDASRVLELYTQLGTLAARAAGVAPAAATATTTAAATATTTTTTAVTATTTSAATAAAGH
ncbi:beta-lactamase family protein [Massilia forsythiae]|uniref:Beta-lactamase family protein n=2 Tax=Massilia forsythiae TaxID=2728020 RepID=A0A7Z2W133_9BURK|nr:beta-lactamase family protein [Massilia forsythiae]